MPHKATRVASPLMTIGGNPVREPARGPAGRLVCANRENLRQQAAELVLVDGKIRTPAHPTGFVQAAAIGGGVIRALGRDDQIRELVGPYTRVVNLRGRLAIPAFGDAHVHPVQGGLESVRSTSLGVHARQDFVDEVAAYSKPLRSSPRLVGGGWSTSSD